MPKSIDLEALERRVDYFISLVKATCLRGFYPEAYELYKRYVEEGHGTQRTLIHLLGDHQRALDTISMFFRGREPRLSHPLHRADLLNRKGYYYREYGEHHTALEFFGRAIWEVEKWEALNKDRAVPPSLRRLVIECKEIICRNMADACYYLGDLSEALTKNKEALRHGYIQGRMYSGSKYHVHSLVFEGFVHFKRGNIPEASRAFKKAITEQRRVTRMGFLDGFRGFNYAKFLLHINHIDEARDLVRQNLETPVMAQPHMRSLWHCISGNIETAAGQKEAAEKHFKNALKETFMFRVLGLGQLEVLYQYGKWLASQEGRHREALEKLEEAEGLATAGAGGHYRMYLPDIIGGIASVYANWYGMYATPNQRGQPAGETSLEAIRKQGIDKALEALRLGASIGDKRSVQDLKRVFRRLNYVPQETTQVHEYASLRAYKLVVVADYGERAQGGEDVNGVLEPLAHGTAWFVDETTIVTAAHVVMTKDRQRWLSEDADYRGRYYPATIRYLLSAGGKPVALEPLYKDSNAKPADIAFLKAKAFEQAGPPCILELVESKPELEKKCRVLGYPEGSDASEGIALTGRIAHFHGENVADKRIQLTLDDRQDVPWNGMSGSPVLVDGKVVGIFLSGSKLTPRMTFAIPANEIRRILRKSRNK
jgi:tetratricopeptide (TPR) repeat protein